MPQRIYVDNSVIGGYFDKEFEEASKLLFSRILKHEFTFVYSEIIEQELIDAPIHVRNLVDSIPADCKEFLLNTKEADILADRYISEKVVGKTSKPDCLHIAIATLNKVDILVSWNFKHIVNINRIRGYNGVNLMMGYSTLEIRTPNEV